MGRPVALNDGEGEIFPLICSVKDILWYYMVRLPLNADYALVVRPTVMTLLLFAPLHAFPLWHVTD